MSGFTYTGENIYTSLSTQPYLKIYSRPFAEGDCVNLGANKAVGFAGSAVSNYIVFYGVSGPPPACVLDFRFDDQDILAEGAAYYTDRDYRLTAVPSQYIGMKMIKTPNEDRNLTTQTGYLTFEMLSAGTVYVAYDSRANSLPTWMSGFTYTGENIYTSLSTQPYLRIYSKSFVAGACVDLGANKAAGFAGSTVSNYIVFLGI